MLRIVWWGFLKETSTCDWAARWINQSPLSITLGKISGSDKSAKKYLAEKGYDEIYGARELARVIQEEIKKPMAEELIFGSIAKGGHVTVSLKNGKINFKYSSKQSQKKELV